MFDELSSKLNATLQRLTGRGVLTEDAVKEGLREIRRILLEADVSFDLTRDFLTRVQEKAVGLAALKEVRPGHQLVKIVYDELVLLLGEKQAPIAHATVPPTIILLVGLQGSGKTTTAGKLARRLKLEQKAPFLVAADVYRPAAIDQLHLVVGVLVLAVGERRAVRDHELGVPARRGVDPGGEDLGEGPVVERVPDLAPHGARGAEAVLVARRPRRRLPGGAGRVGDRQGRGRAGAADHREQNGEGEGERQAARAGTQFFSRGGRRTEATTPLSAP